MAIAFVAAADGGQTTAASTWTFSPQYTVGSGANRLLIVSVLGDATTDKVTGVTHNGVAMTLINKQAAGFGGRWQYLFYLLNPASGAHDIIVSASGSCDRILGGAADYTGVSPSVSLPAALDATGVNGESSSATSLTTSLTTIADNDWFFLLETGFDTGAAPGAGTGVTRRTFDATFGAWGLFDSNGSITPPGSYSGTTTRSNGSTPIGHIVAAFRPFIPVPSTWRGRWRRPGIPRINWNHPLAQGLMLYGYDTGDGQIVDLVKYRRPRVTGHPLIGKSPAGAGILWDNNTGRAITFEVNVDRSIPVAVNLSTLGKGAAWSMACSYIQTSVCAFGGIFGAVANASESQPFGNWYLAINDTTSQTQLTVNNNGTAAGISGATGLTLNQHRSYMATAYNTGAGGATATVEAYENGKFISNLTSQNIQWFGATGGGDEDSIGFGRSFHNQAGLAGTNQTFNGFVFWGAFWNRRLSAADAKKLDDDPYCFLIWPEDDMFATLVGVAAVVTPWNPVNAVRRNWLSRKGLG